MIVYTIAEKDAALADIHAEFKRHYLWHRRSAWPEAVSHCVDAGGLVARAVAIADKPAWHTFLPDNSDG